MNICIMVQDFHKSIGHSRAMIDLLNHCEVLKPRQIIVIAFNSDDLTQTFDLPEKDLKFVRVPLSGLKPHLLRNFFYHLYTWYYCLFFLPKNTYKISIGFASWVFDLANIQFLHGPWKDKYFELTKLTGFKKFYKSLLLGYYVLLEKVLYRNPSIRLTANSQYIKDFCQEMYQVGEDRISLVYSGINQEDFKPNFLERESLFNELASKYSLTNINPQEPIFLFVGAFERKGLKFAMECLIEAKQKQLIVVGKPEDHLQRPHIPEGLNVAFVGETREIQKFYELADSFIFPTLYEPFGLVLVEAAIYGLPIFTLRKYVGASELLEGSEEVYFLENDSSIKALEKINILDPSRRKDIMEKRSTTFEKLDWNKSAKLFEDIVFKHAKELRIE